MKKLFIIRHAKSDWSDTSLDDFDRPLNNRGLKNAPFMGKLLKEKGVMPDLIISSSANRTFTTAQIFASQLGYLGDILLDKNLYEVSANTIESIVKNVSDNFDTIFLIGHNPGLQMFAETISKFEVDNMPTCAVVEIDFKVDSWKDISRKESKLISYDYPKKFK